jgi:hypothetical protein
MTAPQSVSTGDEPLERLLTPQEIAAAWRVDINTVRRLFIDHPGVLRLSFPRRGRRSYVTLRIPRNLFESVQRERMK